MKLLRITVKHYPTPMTPDQLAEFAWGLWDLYDLDTETDIIDALVKRAYNHLSKENRHAVLTFVAQQSQLEEAGYAKIPRPQGYTEFVVEELVPV